MTILGLLKVALCSESNIFLIDKNIFSTQRWGGGSGPP